MSESRIDCLGLANSALACATAAAEGCTRHVAELEEALRTLIARDAAPEVIEQKRAELDDARKRCADVRAAEETAQDHVRATIEISFPGGGTGTPSLLGVYPAVLLPARLETRFDIPSSTARRSRPTLMVRIYPDEIAIETHEPPLTAAEGAAAADYWARVAGGEQEDEVWRRLLLTYPSTRAAWIVRAGSLFRDTALARAVGVPGQGHGTRASSWTRPAITRVMPDRWHVRAFRGGNLVASVTGRAIVSPLTVSMDPSVDPDDPSRVEDVSGHGLLLERNLKWTVDFETAVQAGMAVRIPLQSDDVANGFDELFAVGIKESLGPGEGAALLGQLFDSHHYTGGFAFLREGTPTHNTSGSRSPFPADDPGGAHSLLIERGAFPRFSDSNGERFVRALGISSGVVDHIEHANLNDYLHGRNFRNALWPGTLGYYIRRLLDPWVTAADKSPEQQYDELDSHEWMAREHFVNFVSGSALPSFRAGRKVYGIVPVTSLRRWQPDAGATAIDSALPPLLRTLLSIWTAGLDGVPRIGRGNDLDADFMATLGMDWRSRTVRVRTMVGPQTHRALLALLGVDPAERTSRLETIRGDAMAAIGHGEWRPLIASMFFATEADRYAHELVAAVLSETDELTPNYMRWISNASIDALRDESYADARPAALLYHVLRFAALVEYDRIARHLIIKTSGGDPAFALRGEPQFIGIGEPVETAWTRFGLLLPVTGSQTIGEYILDPARQGEAFATGLSYRTALGEVEYLPTAELDRLFATTLDLCSHRLDPWITSLPAKRLDAMRDRSRTGTYIGGYGWVVNVRPPVEETSVVLVDGRVAVVREGRGGYIHSAELTQASAAAILRNAYAMRSGADAERYGIDLNSGRVAKAMRLLEKVPTGESLGSALGHQFERGLRRRGWIAQLKSTVDSLRRSYPLIANKLADSHEPADKVAARNVVDGLRMLDAFRDGSIVYDPLLLPANSDRRAAVEYGLRELDETLDAVGDLLTAESVFQTVRGNTAAAGASLDALSRGGRPPSIESIRQPRGGTTLTHRFAIVLGGGSPAAPLWTAPLTPRALAEPHLDAWLGNLLGDPARIRCRAVVSSPSLPGGFGELEISLVDLKLRPIDFYYIAGGEELEQRVRQATGSPGTEIDHTPWADRLIRSFGEAIEVMRAARELVASGRPLRPEDLVAPLHSTAAKAQAMSGGGRAAAARTSFESARDALALFLQVAAPPTGPLLNALDAASLFGIAGTVITVPLAFPTAPDEMVAAAREAVKEMDRRLDATKGTSLTDEAIVSGVFGPDFLFLREFVPYASKTLAQALAQSPSLIGDPLEVPKWIRNAAPVREPLARFRMLAMYADAFGATATAFAVAQLPFMPGASWVALPFADEAQRPPSGCMSIVLQRAVAPPPNSPWAGLMVDEWTEVIPAATAQTAVSFEYEQPRAEAPQAVLVAVPPVPRERWSIDEVLDCVRETLQLAQVRGADLETLGEIGQLIPALCITANAAGDAVSVPLTTLLEERVASTLPET